MALKPDVIVKKAHVFLMGHPNYRFLSAIMMMGKVEVTDDGRAGPFNTAGTDGFNVWYHPEFISSLDEKQVRGLVLHENWHKAYRQITTWLHLAKNPDDRMLLNRAMDFVINLEIKDSDPKGEFIDLPPNGCYDEQYRGMNVPQVLKLLKKQQKCGSGSGSDGQDFHDFHDFDGAKKMTAEEVKAIGKEIDRALRQGGMMPGQTAGGMPRSLQELLQPRVDWKTELAEFVKQLTVGRDDSSWSKFNRRWLGSDVYLPAMVSLSIGKLLVDLDMSGSIGQTQVDEAMGEVVSIAKEVRPESIDILSWDTEIGGHQRFEPEDFDGIEMKVKLVGGGGTDASVVPPWVLAQKPKEFVCRICITDGYVGSWGDPEGQPPTLFLITSPGIVAPWGKTLHIDV